ncbi:aldo/keto reductase [Wenzhouxiangella sp. XN24]|uniref:aldo/keto reductase n=1 Tax=Wenzhouxiangella sp. XN24 TaxID=2713569 RepID=UPI0013EAFE94|nr:aldo/keto reductase [Wenzhouxiangella sp. XN24]NGX16338.1 aldo/keto reductase [Wenzhouxiangella sp. XN24]
MDYFRIPDTDLEVSRIALGSWAIGGWMWGGTERKRSIETVHAALERGVNLVDTAPVYGFGKSEEIVGEALREYGGDRPIHVSTKVGLDWTDDEQIVRNGSRDRIRYEIDASLKRLGRDVIDIYFVHWPDSGRPIADTARAMRELLDEGRIRAVGVSNFTPDQIAAFLDECPVHLCQPPYNILERDIETHVKPFCERRNIALMTYGALCRGLLSGKMSKDREFEGDDLRNQDPKFAAPRFEHYLAAAADLESLAKQKYDRSLLAFSLRWILEQGVAIAIWGGRKPSQMEPIDEILGWSMDLATLSAVDSILAEHIEQSVGPEFMAPPTGMEPAE